MVGKKMSVPIAQQDFFGGQVSQWSIYEAIRRGKLPAVKIGRRILLDSDDLKQWWLRQAAESVADNHGEHYGALRRVR